MTCCETWTLQLFFVVFSVIIKEKGLLENSLTGGNNYSIGSKSIPFCVNPWTHFETVKLQHTVILSQRDFYMLNTGAIIEPKLNTLVNPRFYILKFWCLFKPLLWTTGCCFYCL